MFYLHFYSLFKRYILSLLLISDISGYFGSIVFISYKTESSSILFFFRNYVFLTTNSEYLSLMKLVKCYFILNFFFYGTFCLYESIFIKICFDWPMGMLSSLGFCSNTLGWRIGEVLLRS